MESNGEGGFSYYNPEAVLLLLDSGLEFAPSSLNSREKRLAKLWKSTGPGFVHILPQMSDHTCQVSHIWSIFDLAGRHVCRFGIEKYLINHTFGDWSLK